MTIIRGKIINDREFKPNKMIDENWPWFEFNGKTYDKKTYKEVKLKSISLQDFLKTHIEAEIDRANSRKEPRP